MRGRPEAPEGRERPRGTGQRPSACGVAWAGVRGKRYGPLYCFSGVWNWIPAAAWPRDWFTGVSHGDEDGLNNSHHFRTGLQNLKVLGGLDPHHFAHSVASHGRPSPERPQLEQRGLRSKLARGFRPGNWC